MGAVTGASPALLADQVLGLAGEFTALIALRDEIVRRILAVMRDQEAAP
jgi:hypothetical protein